MHSSVLKWFESQVSAQDLTGKCILEVGSYNVNGTVRPIALRSCQEYIGVDMRDGPLVDRVMLANEVFAFFGSRFEVVISTEMLEHAEDWKAAIDNMKQVLLPKGLLALTTRSQGFPLHETPGDWWRFSVADMQQIFADFQILDVRDDPEVAGVFVKAVKPWDWVYDPSFLDNIQVYSMQRGKV